MDTPEQKRTKAREYARKYHALHPEKRKGNGWTKEQRKAYYEKNKARILAHNRAYSKKNWERVKEMMRNWKKNNPEKNREVIARHYSNLSLRRTAYKRAHPELYQLKNGKYRKISLITPAFKKLQREVSSKKYWQKNKNNKEYRDAHRIRARLYWLRTHQSKKRQKLYERLIYVLAHKVNKDRIEKEKLKLLYGYPKENLL